MAEDVHPSHPNPCCAPWIKRSEKLERSRDALRQSVKILEAQIEKQSVEIASVKKEAENQQMQRGQQKDERIKEANIKKDLEKQIVDLKVKISSLEDTKSLNNVYEDEIRMLKTNISAGQEEVKSLKELLEKEMRKTGSEGRKIELEKKKATEAWKLLKDEKRKAEEHKFLLEAEKKKSEDFRLCLQKSRVEVDELREKLSAEIAKVYAGKKQIEVEKLKANEERKRANSERTNAKKQKKLIEEERKRVLDVKQQANHFCQQLEDERRKTKQIQKKLEDLSVMCNFGDRKKDNACKTLKAAELKLLKKRLRLERKRVKHAERVAKQEKYEKRIVLQEVHLLKQNLIQILYRLNMLDGLVSYNVASTADVQKMNHDSHEYILTGREPCCVQEAGPVSSEFGIDQAVTSLGNKEAFLKNFENMISGGCLKLLELDNYSDEVRYINALKMPLSPTLPKIEVPIIQLDAEKLTKGNSFISAEKVTGHNNQQPLESGSMATVPNLTSPSSSLKVKALSKVVDETDPGRIIHTFTSFSSDRNMGSMSRIICAFNSITPQNLMVSKIDLLIVEVLDRLQLADLQSEEKVAVFFSLLLGNLSKRMSDLCKQIVDEDSFRFLESFSSEIVTAITAGKAKLVLDQMFHLDILFCLMESFLIAREVLVIGDVKQHPSSFPASPDFKFHLDVGNNCVLSEDVTISQFIAGCTVLASICVATDDIGVLLVFSYKLLQTRLDDITWVLLALHVFANIIGKKFFNLVKYKFLVTTINSLVSLLEGRLKLVSFPPPCYLNSTSRMAVDFSPCKQCPFAADAIRMEKLASFLLDTLEDYSLTGKDYPITNNYFKSLNGSNLTGATKDNDSSDTKSKCDVQCDASCPIFRHREVTGNQPSGQSGTAFCDFTDIVSLVELVGHYMGWVWMYNEAVPRLLKMLENCVCEEFSAALFVLLGELGRHGSSSGGYQQAEIEELRSKLSKLLDTLIVRKSSLPTQVAAVGAILNLLPMKFEDILYEHRDITLDSCESPYIKQMQKWFFKLSGEQQAAVKNSF